MVNALNRNCVLSQRGMANALDSNCALSQRAWRLYRRTLRRGSCRTNDRNKITIDSDLVFQFADLALAEMEDLASAIGSTVDLILENILEVQCASMMIEK
jgi:cleavage and polyadenylation specificity factor subunit 1